MLNIRNLFFAAMAFQFPATAATPAMQRKHDRQVLRGSVSSSNRYMPHQGARERLRRRIGGFHVLHNSCKSIAG